MITARFHFILLVCCALFGGQKAVAAGWLMDAWRVEDGLPDNNINAIAQTPDGYLWLGTQGGLTRFDGLRFQPVDDPALRFARVRRLFVDCHQRLWIIGETGEVASIQDGKVTSFTTDDGLPPNGFNAYAEDAQGRVWFSGRLEEGCFYFDGQKFINGLHPDWEAMGQFNSLGFDAAGNLYGARQGELWRLAPDEPEDLSQSFEIAPQEIPQLFPSRQHGLWLVVKGSCYWKQDASWQRLGTVPETTCGHEDAAGVLWLAAKRQAKAFGVATNGTVTEQVFSRFGLNSRALFGDREGNWWWSTGNNGLRRFRPRLVSPVVEEQNLPANPILAVAADPQAGVWVLLGRGVVRIANPEKPAPALLKQAIGFPNCLWADADETVWVGSSRGDLSRVSPKGLERFRVGDPADVASPIFSAIFREAPGRLLLGSPEGLSQWESNTFSHPTLINGKGRSDVRVFAQDSQGRVYAGLRAGGLFQREGNQWTRVTNSLPGDDLAALYCDAEDTLWIGVTGHGLVRLRNGQVHAFAHEAVPLPHSLHGILEDQWGFLWFSSSQGIFRASRAELNAVAEGRATEATVRRFDQTDGMPSIQCSSGQQPVSARSRDGRLWFATARGLCVIDPAPLARTAPMPPPVAIEEVLLDGETIWTRPLNSVAPAPVSLAIPPDGARLEFRFAALGLGSPQRNRIRYQLAPWDGDWQEAQEERSAQYTRVRPGNYHFRVIAANEDGVWNRTGASLAVVFLPPWWQNFWFRSGVAVAGILLAGGAYRLRMRHLERERIAQLEFSRRLIESQEQERQRIAAELHDGLGQSLLVVKNYAFLALRENTPPEKMRQQLQEISTNTTASLEEVRNLARALRPYQLDRFGLTKTLEDVTELLAKASDLKIETKIDDVDSAFPPEAQIAIYRVVQEWANNVIKHAHAAHARLTVAREPARVCFVMEDDGVGFDYAAVQARSGQQMSFGLVNLLERVRLLGGTLKIESAPGRGTRLLMELPT